jgi:hypothetical protein
VQVVGYLVPRRLFLSGGIPYQQKDEHGNEQLRGRRLPTNGCSGKLWLVFRLLLLPR